MKKNAEKGKKKKDEKEKVKQAYREPKRIASITCCASKVLTVV